MLINCSDSEVLIRAARHGDGAALQRLLDRYRPRLRREIVTRFDSRLAPRLDPSDVVQEALADAALNLEVYLRDRPLPFYFWVRRIAFERLVQVKRFHLWSRKRNPDRERRLGDPHPEGSARDRPGAPELMTSGTSPSGYVTRHETRERLRANLDRLPARDREILNLHYLQNRSIREVAHALGLGESAVKMRHLRALSKLRRLLEGGREHD